MSGHCIDAKCLVTCTALLCCLRTVQLAAEPERPFVLGSMSCGNATCHGNLPERGPSWRSSQTIWEAEDPHADAGLVLLQPVSQRIVEALDPNATTDERRMSVLESRCFSCHTTLTAAELKSISASATSTQPAQDAMNEGVSCESCHGPASSWIKEHAKTSWSGSQRFDAKTGMLDTESWLPRVEVCVRCHIGSHTADGIVRDVNHDLIAAGHPALRFDALLHNLNLPKHWDQGSKTERPLRDVPQSVLHESGRWKALAAATALSRDRIQSHQVDASVPWPELADYDCFGCHHELKVKSGRRRSASAGKAYWNPWYTTELSLRTRFSLPATVGAADPASQLLNFEKLVQTANNHAATLMRQDFRTPLESLRSAIARGNDTRDWHDAAAWYLSVRAALADCKASQALPLPIAGEMDTLVQSLEQTTLRFSRPDSAMESPRYFSGEAFQETRNELTNLLLQANSE